MRHLASQTAYETLRSGGQEQWAAYFEAQLAKAREISKRPDNGFKIYFVLCGMIIIRANVNFAHVRPKRPLERGPVALQDRALTASAPRRRHRGLLVTIPYRPQVSRDGSSPTYGESTTISSRCSGVCRSRAWRRSIS